MTRAPSSAGKRLQERVHTRLRVQYGVDQADRCAFAESISEGGLHINTNEVYKVGTRLIVRIEFPGRTVCHRGEVAWAIKVPEHLRDSMVCGMGISFTEANSQWSEFFHEWNSSLPGCSNPGLLEIAISRGPRGSAGGR